MTRPARRRSDPVARTVRRAAIYTRVSTDEQTVLEFNSLEAQEQICRTYISMREADPGASERWVHAQTYCDPGYSGGTLDRPALGRLLDEVEAGRVDTILVYKIDRLSRSIHQFYRIWEILVRHNVDLVSATQDLNTSTSQGKLMLNMLLSFGQFEREQIGERTRDKIHAARKRGKWTGGPVPLGYDLRDGRLVVNEAEAATVREIFEVYQETGSLTRSVEELACRGMTMKTGAHGNGSARSARAFDKPSLLRVLRNPTYAGLTRCNGSLADGEHDAIVDPATWQRVQDRMTRNGRGGYQGERANCESLLTGLLRCAQCGSAMTPTYTLKHTNGRVTRHRYYRCANSIRRGAHACPTGSVPALEVEQRVVEQIREIGRDPALIAETVRQARVQRDELVAQLEAEEKALRREMRGKRAGSAQERIAAIEARLAALPGEMDAAKRATISDQGIRSALEAFGPTWAALWPVERARIIDLLVERIDCAGRRGTIAIRFRSDGIGSLTSWAELGVGGHP